MGYSAKQSLVKVVVLAYRRQKDKKLFGCLASENNQNGKGKLDFIEGLQHNLKNILR